MSRALASGTWCERHVPSVRLPSTYFGPVQPFGVRKMIIGQSGRSASSAPWSPASRRIRAMWSSTSSNNSAKRRWKLPGSSSSNPAVNTYGVWPYPFIRSTSSSSPMRASTAGLAILNPLRWSTGSTTPSVTGLRNLLECQLVASGPVSASPSPTTAKTNRPGLSNAAP